MNVDIKPGNYVVAVSGGVDSVVLLDLLAKQPNSRIVDQSNSFAVSCLENEQNPTIRLIVAHFDHGMRPDSEMDRLFVEQLAKKYELSFVYGEGRLGATASEATARKARYDFLRKAQKDADADAVITAHHQDDVLETAIINLLRGTGRRGLTALASRKNLLRPLLDIPKTDIETYAKQHQLEWRDDPTNLQTDYLRNYVRHKILPRFPEAERHELLQTIAKVRQLNDDLDAELVRLLRTQPATDSLSRRWFTAFPHDISKEILATWLRHNHIANYDRRTLERLVVAAKVATPGSRLNVKSSIFISVGKHKLALTRVER